MKNVFKGANALIVSLALLTGAFAETCPFCHMPLASKMSKTKPVAVRLKKGGKVLYCCAACKMPASVIVKKK